MPTKSDKPYLYDLVLKLKREAGLELPLKI